MPCDECDALRRQLREAREEIAEYEAATDSGDTARINALRIKLRIRPMTAKVIDTLMDKPGMLTRLDYIVERTEAGGKRSDTMPPSRRGPLGVVRTNISWARKALVEKGIRGGIVNMHGEGYTMTKEAARAVEALL